MTQLLATAIPRTVQDNPLRVLLRRRGAVYLPEPANDAGDGTDATSGVDSTSGVDVTSGVDLLEADLLDRGWLVSPLLRDALLRLAVTDLVAVGSALLSDCDALIGADVPHVPLFRNFPASTPRDTMVFFVDRVLFAWFQQPGQPCVLCDTDGTVQPVNPCGHLVCGTCFDGSDFSACPICHRRVDIDDPYLKASAVRPEAVSDSVPRRTRVLHLGRDADADIRTELAALLGRPAALPPADVADLAVLMDTRRRDDLTWMPSDVPGRETKARLVGWILAATGSADAFVRCGDLIGTATDVLRALVVLSGGEPSLIGRPKFAPIGRPLRRTVLGWLDRIEPAQLVEDMRRDERAWIRAGERLHPGEFAGRYPTAALAFAVLRRTDVAALRWMPKGAEIVGGRVRVPSLGSQVEQRLVQGATAEVAGLLAARRPGELLRRLDQLLRRDLGQADHVLRALVTAAPHVAPAVLLSALGQLRTRAGSGTTRVFFPASKASVAHVIPEGRVPLPPDLVGSVVTILEGELLRRAALLPRVGRAVIDRDLDGLVVPFAQRTAARSLVTLARGSVLALPAGRYLRLFCHWMQRPDQRVDLDLSVALFDSAWNHVGTCDYTHLRAASDGAVHSGDLTSAPAPLGASEFVDLDLDRLSGARYAVMVVFSFNSTPFTDLAEAFAGWMLRADPGTDGAIFEPRSVEQRFDLAGPGLATLPMIVDVTERTVRWLDVAPRVTGDGHAVHRHHGELGRVADALVESFGRGTRVTIGELARVHAAARADEVIVRDGAGLVLYQRQPGESAAAFAVRLGDPGRGDAVAPDLDGAGLQLLTRGDVPVPDGGADVFALHAGGLDASKVRLRGADDFVADLAPAI